MTRKAAITGVGNTKVGEVPGSTCMSLHTEAALNALEDAGLKLADIDGVICAFHGGAGYLNNWLFLVRTTLLAKKALLRFPQRLPWRCDHTFFVMGKRRGFGCFFKKTRILPELQTDDIGV